MITGATLDHVALALERWEDSWPRYAAELGGQWVSGGTAPGFGAHQLRYANGAKLELICPFEIERNDFLRRFIDRNGVGPHHVTFKVPDIRSALREVESAGYNPVNVDLSDPNWKEAFIHPKDAPGIVVQLAESDQEWSSPEPDHFPAAVHHTAVLERVTHAVADLDEALTLFTGLLGGRQVDDGPDWLELAWDKPGRIRFASGPEAAEWIGPRRGRTHHLAFACSWLEEPVTVEPDENLGTRLVMFPG